MINAPATDKRPLKTEQIEADFVVVGGGLAGTCAAIAASRQGLKTYLIQDRPVLGGNASSEVRLWVLGATSHMGNNNRWAREGGIMNEILEDNLHRNRHGNSIIFDTILLEKCRNEKNLTLLLNTAVFDLEKSSPSKISAVKAFCSQNSTQYELAADTFCDASGDGVVGFMAGAAFRMGAEAKEEFGEGFAPDSEYGELLGHSLYFYTKDVGTPVSFTAPDWALKDITKIPRYRQFNTNMQGCNFWWVEYGGRLDTVHATEDIKWELWKVVYGIWDHIKNSGEFPDAETMTLEWVGHIPGKRESRRFEGDYMMRQQDVIDQTQFDDAIAHGGWAIDLHPADGVYSEKPGCTQWHSKGVYGLPYRSHYSKNIDNLFIAGRLISASHVAFGSTRVMATCGAGGQAIGTAAALCKTMNLSPRELGQGEALRALQAQLSKDGQHLPGQQHLAANDLVQNARVSTSSTLELSSLEANDQWHDLEEAMAMLLPLSAGMTPQFTVEVDAAEASTLEVNLLQPHKNEGFTPGENLGCLKIAVPAGKSQALVDFNLQLKDGGYHFIQFQKNTKIKLQMSDQRLTGVLSVFASFNKAVATTNIQSPPEGIGVESFEFWLPKRRPAGHNLAMQISPPLLAFSMENLTRAVARPTQSTNAWVACPSDAEPRVTLSWDQAVELNQLVLDFDPDWDHAMESVLMTHPEEVSPFMVTAFTVEDADGNILYDCDNNHQAHRVIQLDKPVSTDALHIHIQKTQGSPAALFRIQAFA